MFGIQRKYIRNAYLCRGLLEFAASEFDVTRENGGYRGWVARNVACSKEAHARSRKYLALVSN